MSLQDKINEELKQAMKAKDEAGLRGLRAIKAALLLAKTEKGASGEITEDVEIKILQKLVKQRKESLEIYQQQKRDDLAKQESEEIAVIEKFLPKQLNKEDLEKGIKEIIQSTGATSIQDMGKVMGIASKRFAGKADGKTISEVVKHLLGV